MVFIALLQFLFTPLVSPLVVGVIRRLKALMQNRQGASVWQPYRDIMKLFQKDEVISRDASWIFRVVPFLMFAVTLVIAASVPAFSTTVAGQAFADFLIIIYLFALGSFLLACAGLDTASAFGGTGSSREMAMAALTEGGLLFSLLAVVVLTGETSLPAMIASLHTISFSVGAPLVVAYAAFMIALLSENARYPFDNPATHLELTMIHEAMILEYSGKRLALVEWTAYNKLLLFIVLGVNMFFPWGVTSTLAPAALLWGFLLVSVKILAIAAVVALIESVIPKFRFFRLPDMLLTSVVLGMVAILLIIF